MPSVVLDIALPADKFMAVYQGVASRVVVQSRDGRKINLAARHLRPFLNHSGIYGSFELSFSDTGSFVSLRKL